MIISETASGVLVDIPDLRPHMIRIEDIAGALGKSCRYNGTCKDFYSVAEHSVHVASILPGELMMLGLLHDASEAFLGDIVRPVKQILPDYRQLENFVAERIYRKYMHRLPTEAEYAAVGAADDAVLITEGQQLLASKGAHFSNLRAAFGADVTISCWDHIAATRQYMQRWYLLTKVGV